MRRTEELSWLRWIAWPGWKERISEGSFQCVYGPAIFLYIRLWRKLFFRNEPWMRGTKIEMPNKTSQSKGRVLMCECIALSEKIEMLPSRTAFVYESPKLTERREI